MIRSMTGFGRAAFSAGGVAYAVEIRSVNHRYLDIKTRLARTLGAVEGAIRGAVGKALKRGRVEVGIQVVGGEAAAARDVRVDLDLARSVHSAHLAIAESLGLSEQVDSALIAAWPGVLISEPPAVDEAELQAAVTDAMQTALGHLVAMRTHEGAALAKVLRQHLQAVDALRARIMDRAPEQSAAYRARLESRMRELLETLDIEVDEGRILHEVAVFAERTDVAEELARLGAHVAQLDKLLDAPADDGVGRRLDFLCQEMFREANTIASKVDDVTLSNAAIELKAELERLREQVQNVE